MGPEFESPEMEAEYNAAVAAFTEAVDGIVSAKVAEMAAAVGDAVNEAIAGAIDKINAVERKAESELKLAAAQKPQSATLTLDSAIEADGELVLPDGLLYKVGSGCLSVYKDGLMLAPELGYVEVGDDMSDRIKLTERAEAGTFFHFNIAPINSGYQAELSAENAVSAERRAADYVRRAESAAESANARLLSVTDEAGRSEARILSAASLASAQMESAAADVSDSAEAAKGWAQAAAKSADAAWEASAEAKKSVALAANQSTRPGIMAMPSLEAIENAGPGVYFINPNLSTPSAFTGIYSADSVEDMTFDGVFYVGKASNVPESDLPAKPLPPARLELAGGSDSWQPCQHSH